MTMEEKEESKSLHKLFPGVIGQTQNLKKLSFLAEIQNNSGYLSPILISGQLGSGKNCLATAFCRNLINFDTKEKPKFTFEVNCPSIESLDDFFQSIVIPRVINNQVAVILDEFHCLQKSKIIDCLLGIWNTENYINQYTYNNQLYNFDSRMVSWICLSSEPHVFPKTLISRMETVELEELKIDELAQIVGKKLKHIHYSPELLLKVASYGRNNGRVCYTLGEKISQYLNSNKKKYLSEEDWIYVKSHLGLRKNGIQNIEYRVMQYLKKNGNASLSKLSSALQLTSDSCRKGFETFLLGNGYIEILPQKGRRLTKLGQEYMDEVKE